MLGGDHNTVSGDHSVILGGNNNNDMGLNHVAIFGSSINAVAANTLHIEGLNANAIPFNPPTAPPVGTVFAMPFGISPSWGTLVPKGILWVM